MKRTPEPELMDDLEQAKAYAAADFSEPHQHYVDLLCAEHELESEARVLDVGCGPGDVLMRLAKALPHVHIDGVDGAQVMVDLANGALQKAQFSERVCAYQKLLNLQGEVGLNAPYDAVVSNSLLHHLHQPQMLWQTIATNARVGASIFVMDLRRPESEEQVEDFVARYAAGEPEVLVKDFRASLHAAFTPDEIQAQLKEAGLNLSVRAVSDRHVVVCGQR